MKSIYNGFARDYDHKRRKPWKPFESFLSEIKKKGFTFNGIILDLGCANARHFKILKNQKNKIIGIDNSIEFLKISYERIRDKEEFSEVDQNYIALILADMKNLPFREASINSIVAVASIHHIPSKESRVKIINDLYKIIIPGGIFILTIWRRWQKRFRFYFFKDRLRRLFSKKYSKLNKEKGLNEFGDILIPWNLSNQNATFMRFYHLFSKRELKNLLKPFMIKFFKVMGGPNNKDNFFVLTQKK
ncbi:MAG: class I SAM-dependent methyltransferase [Promethearchaeia archaeon]